MRRYMLIAAVLLLTATGIFAAQQKPDFSGERILNRQASTLSLAISGVQSRTQSDRARRAKLPCSSHVGR
jgi:hypothetical protein